MYREWAPNAVTASLVGDFSKSFLFFCYSGGLFLLGSNRRTNLFIQITGT